MGNFVLLLNNQQNITNMATDNIDQNEEKKDNDGNHNANQPKINKETLEPQPQKEPQKITIELLNWTGDKDLLVKAKNQLKEAGYDVRKSGETSVTEKTTIINRTNQARSVGKEIIEVLGYGTTTSGSDNSKVDFTIILGQDYE